MKIKKGIFCTWNKHTGYKSNLHCRVNNQLLLKNFTNDGNIVKQFSHILNNMENINGIILDDLLDFQHGIKSF